MKILITHFYSENNKGDLAILSSMITQIKKTAPLAQISVLTCDKKRLYSTEKTTKLFGSIFYYCIYKNNNPILRMFNSVYYPSVILIWVLVIRYLSISIPLLIPNDLKQTLYQYINADLILCVGGGYINGKNNISSHVTLALHLHSILISKLLNKPTILYSQSIGPFKNSLQEFAVSKILKNTDMIFARENITFALLLKMGIAKSKLVQTIDEAFRFSTKDQFIKNKFIFPKKKSDRLIGITVRRWFSAKQQNEYESVIASFAIYLSKTKNTKVVFIPQVTSQMHNDDDRVVSARIKKSIGNNLNVFFLNDNFNPHELKRIFKQLDFLVGTRMHSVIFALTENVPCIAIEYEFKTLGIMQSLGIDEYSIKIENLSKKKLIDLFNKMVYFEKAYKISLLHSLKTYQNEAQSADKILKSFLIKN